MLETNPPFKKVDPGHKKIYSEVIQQIKEETNKIILEGVKRAKLLREAMKKEVEEEIQNILYKARKIAELRKNKILSTSEIEIRRINLSKKNKIMELFFKQALNKLEEFTQSNPKYKDYLIKYIRQGIESVYSFKMDQIETKMEEIIKFFYEMKLNPENIERDKVEIIIYINEKDQKYLTNEEITKFMNEFHITMFLKFDNNILGGAIISTSDQSVLFNNSFSERLFRKKSDLIRKISDIFWA